MIFIFYLQVKSDVSDAQISNDDNEDQILNNTCLTEEEEEYFLVDSSGSSECESSNPTKKQKSTIAVNIAKKGELSSNKVSRICDLLNNEGISVPNPCQSGVYKGLMKEGKRLKDMYKEMLKQHEWSLHFDGKIIKKKEYQVIVLKNATKEIKLAVLELKDGKGSTIYEAVKMVIDEYDLWKSIKMIVTANTGKINGSVSLLQDAFRNKGLEIPQYIGCQHHILDTVLKHVLNKFFHNSTVSPELNYDFILKLTNDYEKLKADFVNNGIELPKTFKERWRDDMAFLQHLIVCYKTYSASGQYPKIDFKALPSLSNSRWNSRAIYTLLAFILIPEYQQSTKLACDFICGKWGDTWFSSQMYNPSNFKQLSEACIGHEKALNSLKNFWSTKDSPIQSQRSNICAERAIKVMQDLLPYSRCIQSLNVRFILSNDEF